MGGDPESLRLILTNQGVRKSVAKILIDAKISSQSLLKFIGTIAIPATTKKFVVAEHFKVGKFYLQVFYC